MKRCGLRCGALLFVLSVAGCASLSLQHPELEPPAPFEPRQVELRNTPFHSQTAYQCGPAALATVLEASGVENADPDELARHVYVPELRGSLQAELLGAIRRADRVPYRLEPRFADLLSEIRAGHPVLVLQNLGLSRWPQWHYAVVIGFDRDAGTVVLRSGETRRQVLSFRRFERTWRLADYWAVVVTKPGDIPVTASAVRYLEAVSALERQHRWHAATSGYEAARERWPENSLSYLGLGNIAYQQAAFQRAEKYFLAAAAVAPDAPAPHYNLAWAYRRQGKIREAYEAARQAEALAPEHSLYANATGAIAESVEVENRNKVH